MVEFDRSLYEYGACSQKVGPFASVGEMVSFCDRLGIPSSSDAEWWSEPGDAEGWALRVSVSQNSMPDARGWWASLSFLMRMPKVRRVS